MDWKDIGKTIVKIGAPLLGTVIGGPAGPALGAMVASALGCDAEPKAVAKAIAADPQAMVKIKEIESNERIRLQELAGEKAKIDSEEALGQILAVNKTMQTEAMSDSKAQKWWRPYWGFISGTAFLIVCCFVCYLAYKAIAEADSDAMGMIPQIIMQFTLLFGIPMAVLGVASWGRNKLKLARVQARLPLRDTSGQAGRPAGEQPPA